MLEAGINIDPKLIGGQLSTFQRKKDMTRSKIANSKLRVNGRFVSNEQLSAQQAAAETEKTGPPSLFREVPFLREDSLFFSCFAPAA